MADGRARRHLGAHRHRGAAVLRPAARQGRRARGDARRRGRCVARRAGTHDRARHRDQRRRAPVVRRLDAVPRRHGDDVDARAPPLPAPRRRGARAREHDGAGPARARRVVARGRAAERADGRPVVPRSATASSATPRARPASSARPPAPRCASPPRPSCASPAPIWARRSTAPPSTGTSPVPVARRADAWRSASRAGPGLRAYVLVAGGFDVGEVLGSASTFTLGGFGGHGGRELRTGDVLHLHTGSLPLAHTGTLPLAHTGTLPLAHTGTLPLAHTGTLPLAHTGTLPLAHTGTLPLAHTGTLPLAHTGTLPLADPEIEALPELTTMWELAVVDGPHAAPDFVTARGHRRVLRDRVAGAPPLVAHRCAPGRPGDRMGPRRRRRGRSAPVERARHALHGRRGRLHR